MTKSYLHGARRVVYVRYVERLSSCPEMDALSPATSASTPRDHAINGLRWDDLAEASNVSRDGLRGRRPRIHELQADLSAMR